MFTAALFTKTRPGSLIDECIKKMWYTYVMEYYSAIKKNDEILPFESTWIDLESIMLGEISHLFHFIKCFKHCLLLIFFLVLFCILENDHMKCNTNSMIHFNVFFNIKPSLHY